MGAVGLSKAAWSVWAKSDRDTDSSLALHRHLTDSAAIAEHLWDDWLPRQSKQVLIAAVGDEADARTLAVWLAGTHDIGKATPEFAKQVEQLTGDMRVAGLKFPAAFTTTRRIPHSVMGYEILREWLRDRGLSFDSAASLAIVAGGHHGTPPNLDELRHLRRETHALGEVPLWKTVRNELLDHVTAFADAEAALDRMRTRAIPVSAQVLYTSFVIIADWIASNTEYFPYGDDFDSSDRARFAWSRLELTPGWSATAPQASVDQLLRDRFALGADARARPVQIVAVEAARELGTGLLIVEAPMGEGKTEAALMAAEVLASQTGAGGCLVALPTMATSDAMFSRVLHWVDRLPDERGVSQPQSAFLAHSKRDLNRDFGRLRRVTGIGDDQHGSTLRLPASVLEAHQWLTGRKKGTLSNFVVGTIDQVLFSALKSKHVVLRHLALANKVVVIDEVHAADAYMSVYLERVLAWLGAYRVPVVLLSATLAPSARIRLAAAYAQVGTEDRRRIEANAAYPCITSIRAVDGAVTVHDVPGSPRSVEIALERLDDDDDTLIERLRPAIEAGAAVAVIRNTVARAQHLARILRAEFGDGAVVLAHSRFIATDRMEIEAELRGRLGPPPRRNSEATQQRRGPIIVVGTQVLEQSLDIDFDLMVSDIAPIDLLLQRAGRLHRHDRAARPHGTERPTLVLTGVDDWAAQPPAFDHGTTAIYGEHLLLRTVLALDERASEPLRVPADLSELVRTVYDGDPPAPDAWAEALTAAGKAWRTLLREKQKKADVFAIAHPDESNDLLVGWLEAPAVGADEDSPGGQQQVRDTEDSIEVLVAQERDAELHVLPWLPGADTPVDRVGRPSSAHAWTLATSSLRLTPQLCRWFQGDRTISALEANAYEGWQQSHLLKGQLVLVLDEELKAEVGGFALEYDRHDGLTVTKLGSGA